MPEGERTRIKALDSLRGLAALTVVFAHCAAALGALWDGWTGPWLKYTPLRFVFLESRFSVILFFVLSGLVLAPPFLGAESPSYPRYAAKRVCRIYLPYMAAVLLSAGLFEILSANPIPSAGPWFKSLWSDPPGPSLLLSHAAMLGTVKSGIFVPPSWSLVHEIRISLILPLLVWCVRRSSFGGLVGAFLVYGACILIGKQLGLGYFTCGLTFFDSFVVTAYFALFFIFGILIAKHRSGLVAGIGLLPGVALFIVGVAVGWGIVAHSDLANGVAAAAVIVLSLRFSSLLLHPICLWLGRVSYSLYLVHVPVLLAVVHLLYGRVHLLAAVTMAMPLSLCAAEIMYRLVEVPSLRLSRRIGRASPSKGDVQIQSAAPAP